MADTATLLAQVVNASGVTPVEWTADWRTRGWTFGSGATFDPKIVVWHHTWLPVPFPTSVLMFGRPDVGGPLCHLNVKPDRLTVIAGEGANHGGLANGSVYQDAIRGVAHDLTAAQRGLEDDNAAHHEHAWGVEVDWAGDPGDPITDWQDDCIKKLMVAWNKVQGLIPGNHITHAETTSRKWDPGFTRSIWKPYRTWLTEHLEDDVALTPEQEAALEWAAEAMKVFNPTELKGSKNSWESFKEAWGNTNTEHGPKIKAAIKAVDTGTSDHSHALEAHTHKLGNTGGIV